MMNGVRIRSIVSLMVIFAFSALSADYYNRMPRRSVRLSTPTTYNVNAGGGVTLWVQCYGSLANPMCVLIGDAGATAEFWPDTLVEQLEAAGYCVVRYDARDTGNSTQIADFEATPYSITDMASDVIAILDTLGASDAHIVGHSMGGYVAQQLAISAPTRVKSLALLCTAARHGVVYSPDQYARFQALWAYVGQQVSIGTVEAYLSMWHHLSGTPSFDNTAATTYTQALFSKGAAGMPTNHIAVMQSSADRRVQLEGVTCPTLVIHGELDAIIFREAGKEIAQAIPGARFYSLPQMGHLPFFVAPGLTQGVVSIILKHVQRV